MLLPDVLDLRAHQFFNLDIAGAFGTQNGKADDRSAIEAREGARLGNGVADEPDIIQPQVASTRERNPGCRKIGQGPGACERADRLVAAADLGPAAGKIGVAAAQLAAHIERGYANPLQRNWIKSDADLALDAADALNAADATQPLQLAHDNVRHEKRKLLGRLARSDGRVGENRQPDNIVALDHGVVDAARQIMPDARDRVLDVVERAIGIDLQPELDGGVRNPVGDHRIEVVNPFDAGHRVLDLLADLTFELDRRCAELRDHDRHHGNVDVRHARDRHARETDKADCDEDRHNDDGWKRLADGPGGDIKRHFN